MGIDLSMLANYRKPVIHCETKEQADLLFESLHKTDQYLFEEWEHDGTAWSWYGNRTCYALHLHDDGFGSFKRIQFSPVEFWEEHGYVIVPFVALANICDFGEISYDQDLMDNILNEIGVL